MWLLDMVTTNSKLVSSHVGHYIFFKLKKIFCKRIYQVSNVFGANNFLRKLLPNFFIVASEVVSPSSDDGYFLVCIVFFLRFSK